MSGRGGGRGGRGGRWGGRGGQGSVTHDLIRDNLEDLGIDSFQQIQDDRTPPPLYPSVELPYPILPKQSDVFAIEKNREVIHRLQQTSYFLTRDTEKKKDNTNKTPTTPAVINCDTELKLAFQKNTVPSEWQRYAPTELFESAAASKHRAGKGIGLDFSKLEQAEKTTKGDGEKGENKEGESDGDELEVEDEVEEMDDDYMVDHYASDNDMDDGDGGGDDREATF